MAEKKQKKAVAKKAAQPAAPKKAAKKAVVKKTTSGTSRSTVSKVAKKTAAKNTAAKTPVKKKAAKKTSPKKGKRSSKKTKNDEECFLTTACVNYYSLADNAYELMTLRTFRDDYLLKSKGGNTLVKHYYRVAPLIVSMINKDKEHKSVYQSIYASVQKACREIEQKKFPVAKQTYISLVNQLSKKYRIGS